MGCRLYNATYNIYTRKKKKKAVSANIWCWKQASRQSVIKSEHARVVGFSQMKNSPRFPDSASLFYTLPRISVWCTVYIPVYQTFGYTVHTMHGGNFNADLPGQKKENKYTYKKSLIKVLLAEDTALNFRTVRWDIIYYVPLSYFRLVLLEV